jgi:OOP family OmpA-OmpF porin
MRSFFISFIFFLFWFAVAFVYISNEATPKLASFLNNLSLNIENSEIKINQATAITDSDPFTEDLEGDGSIVKNQALLHIFMDEKGYLFSLDTLYIKKNVDSVYFSTFEEKYFHKLLQYISENENVELLIESDYSATENFTTPNMGVRRGEFLLNTLAENGIDPYLMNVKSNIKELNFSEDNKFFGGIHIQIKPMDSIRKAEIDKNRVIKRTVYPTFTFARIIANKDLDDFANELKSLLVKHPTRSVQIIGHTDNIGSAIDNYQLGLKYAQQVRWYLINTKGIEASNLRAMSKGEEDPIDDNNSQSGRKNNLRIEFIIE